MGIIGHLGKANREKGQAKARTGPFTNGKFCFSPEILNNGTKRKGIPWRVFKAGKNGGQNIGGLLLAREILNWAVFFKGFTLILLGLMVWNFKGVVCKQKALNPGKGKNYEFGIWTLKCISKVRTGEERGEIFR